LISYPHLKANDSALIISLLTWIIIAALRPKCYRKVRKRGIGGVSGSNLQISHFGAAFVEAKVTMVVSPWPGERGKTLEVREDIIEG